MDGRVSREAWRISPCSIQQIEFSKFEDEEQHLLSLSFFLSPRPIISASIGYLFAWRICILMSTIYRMLVATVFTVVRRVALALWVCSEWIGQYCNEIGKSKDLTQCSELTDRITIHHFRTINIVPMNIFGANSGWRWLYDVHVSFRFLVISPISISPYIFSS